MFEKIVWRMSPKRDDPRTFSQNIFVQLLHTDKPEIFEKRRLASGTSRG
jgi:hypothetical protein